MRIIMLGAPGAGKGTQAIKISDKFNIPQISTGDIFRKQIKNKTEIGLKAKGYIDQGMLVPDELVVDLVIARIEEDDCKNGYILDGFPRTIPQAKALDAALNQRDLKLDYVVNIEIPDENIIRRMAGRRACINCGATYHIVYTPTKVENVCDVCNGETTLRSDDKPETVYKRLEIYHEQTQPLILYYKEQSILIETDGVQDSNEIFNDIVSKLV
ncbi:MAG TPA: adenylate kinase [Clostridiales bacterium]|nr:adenylate kinase [Clostridiales bacterium]